MMTIRLLFCLGLGLLSSLSSSAQGGYVDSLLRIGRQAPDTQRLTVWLEIGWHYFNTAQYDSCRYYARRADTLGRALRRPAPVAEATELRALSAHSLAEEREAIRLYHLARRRYAALGRNYADFWYYTNLGNNYTYLGAIDTAIVYYDSARAARDTTDLRQQLRWTGVMGFFYDHQQQYDRALDYRRRAYRLARDRGSIAQRQYTVYDLAYQFETLDRHDSAIHYLAGNLPLLDSLPNPDMEWRFKACLGICHIERGEYARGVAYLEEVQPLAERYDKSMCCGNDAYHAKALIMLGRADEARPLLTRARSQLPEIRDLRDKHNVLQALLDVYEHLGQYDSAFATVQLLREVDDSMTQRQFRESLAEMEVRYDTREKELRLARQEARLTSQRRLVWALLIGGGLLAGLVLLYRRYYRQKQELAGVLAERNARLRELDRAKSTFFANISHEFRTPLTLILGPLREASERVQEFSLREQLRLARRNAGQLLRLVEELLTLSRLEADRLTIEPVPTLVPPRLRRTVEAFRSLADQRRIELVTRIELDPELGLLIDWAQFEKIVNNLLGNALKYAPADSRVSLYADWVPAGADRGHLALRVVDAGPGIPAAERERIFERYYQGDHAGSPLGGTGIGLAFARELTQAMGGTLEVHDNEFGGSTFRLRLPLMRVSGEKLGQALPAASVATEPTPATYQSPASAERPALLVIEDQPDMQQYLRHVLSPHFHVRVAGDTRAAQALLEYHAFQLVLSDLMLPGEDGIAFLQRVRAGQTVYRDLPFVILTARAGRAERLDCLRLGIDDYLTKPFVAGELIARLHNVLRNVRTREQAPATATAESSVAEQLVRDAEAAVTAHLSDNEFGAARLAKALGYSLRNLERRLKPQTGLTPARFIREIRLRAAYQLLERGRLATVSEVSLAVGFLSAAHFSRIFSKRFGVPPSTVLGRASSTA